jgi:hypothetical protein
MNTAKVVEPAYRVRGVPEIDSNPLLAHLPLPPETDNDAFMALALRPDFDPRERDLPNSIRRLRIKRLRRFYVPTLKAHRQALIDISTNVFDGYIPRNPMTAEGQALLYGGAADLDFRPTISLVAGHSGMGKSTLIDRIVGHLGNQLHRHVCFDGKPFTEKQILFLRRNCPEHCTVGTLCSTFGDYTDRVLGLKLYSGVFAKLQGGSRTLYLSEISRIIKNHHVGLLVLDEFQNLSLMGVGAKKIIALLVNLRDELGLPIVVVGTYKALRLLEGDMSTARRLVEGGYFDLERPASAAVDSWVDLCQIAWAYQWVRKPVDFDSDICEALYEVSQGITGIMISAFAFAQLAAIEDGTECVDAALIRKVYLERMKPLHPAIRILQSGDPILIDKFDDLYKNLWPTADREEEFGAPETPIAANAKCESEKAEEADDAPMPASTRSNRKGAATLAAPVKAVLSEEQVKKMVMADSVGDLISILDKR